MDLNTYELTVEMDSRNYWDKHLKGTRLAVEMLEAMERAGRELSEVVQFGFRAELKEDGVSKNGYLQFKMTGKLFYTIYFQGDKTLSGEYQILN